MLLPQISISNKRLTQVSPPKPRASRQYALKNSVGGSKSPREFSGVLHQKQNGSQFDIQTEGLDTDGSLEREIAERSGTYINDSSFALAKKTQRVQQRRTIIEHHH